MPTVSSSKPSAYHHEKTIITMQNTMGAYLDQLVIDHELRDGDPIVDTGTADADGWNFVSGFTWNRVLDRNIDKALTITIKDARDPSKTEKI